MTTTPHEWSAPQPKTERVIIITCAKCGTTVEMPAFAVDPAKFADGIVPECKEVTSS